ncbi:MAG TPA: hypothetical protein VFE05_22935 [Longimicrobiaceae bacterium]|nr:hypothetical protein [Longimicrobiaceae bacterium]
MPFARSGALLCATLLAAAACSPSAPSAGAPSAAKPEVMVALESSLSPAERETFYHLAQGSEILPTAW